MKKYKILIVDDIFINRVLLFEVVKSISSKCKDAENGKQALDMLRKESFDIILMDIEMPEMNGIEATKQIRNTFPPPVNNIPIIAVTAYDPKIFFKDHKEIGFNDLVTKPYTIEKINELIENLCNSKGKYISSK